MNIVFDIGNVICEWNAEKLVRTVFSRPDQQKKALQNIIGHADWLNLDRGIIELDDAIQRACARTQISEDLVKKLYEETPRSLLPFSETVDLIKELKDKGHTLYVLSNMHLHAWAYLTATYDFWTHFSGIVISSHIKCIKPEAKIYKYLLNTWNLQAKDTIFLDDLHENLATARKFGIKTLLVTSPALIRPALNLRLTNNSRTEAIE